ncbi:MAG: pectate lyase [Candidatus Sigynarchaeota archaeon]
MARSGNPFQILGIVLGAGALAALVVLSILYRYDFLLVPFILPAFIGLGFLTVPISIQALVHVIRRPSEKPSMDRGILKAMIFIGCVVAAVACFWLSFVAWWDEILFDMDKVVFILFMIFYTGGFAGNVLLAMEILTRSRTKSFLGWRAKGSPERRGDERPVLGTTSTVILLVMMITVGVALPIYYLTEPDTCNREPGRFSQPAYDWTWPSVHVNCTKLDNPALVNQTILRSLEKAMWKMTTLQRAGGFPIGSDLEGVMYSDRGDGCPLFYDEFSLQGGTRLVGKVYLEMFKVTNETRYLNVARKAADALVAVQDQENGGFFYDGRRHGENGPGYQPHPRNPNRANVLDDNVMQGCMDFLLDFYNVTLEPKYLVAINKGLQCLIDTEKENGGWPQCSNYPIYSYQSRITLNDGAMRDTVNLLIKAARMFPARTDLPAMIIRAGDFLKRTQGNGGSSFQQGWAQQYDERTEMPCWGRNFEPPSISSSDGTKSAIEMLMNIYAFTNDPAYLAPIPAAIAWLNGSRVNYTDGGITKEGWARLYELGTNIPIFGLADGGPYRTPEYSYTPVRGGYSWYVDVHLDDIVADYEYITHHSIPEWLAYKTKTYTVGNTFGSAWSAHLALDSSGFWLDGGLIKDKVFAGKAMDMIHYIQAAIA